jgi:hypothetical protein
MVYDTLALPELQALITADEAKQLEKTTSFTVADALRAAAGCSELVQIHGTFGDGVNTACGLSAVVAVAERIGYLA